VFQVQLYRKYALGATILLVEAGFLYDGGMRLAECLRLRAKELGYGCQQVTVRERKGEKDGWMGSDRLAPGASRRIVRVSS
jgi:integrase